MKPGVMDEDFVKRLCKGDALAMQFFALWYRWVHEIDDLVDELATVKEPEFRIREPGERLPQPAGLRIPTAADREKIVATFADAIIVLGHPFYVQHMPALRTTALLIANRYADTVKWENEPAEEWQRVWADHHRGVAMEMGMAIAMICGGWDHARSMSLELVELCYHNHHDTAGKPT